jgi:hypothetical protein
MPEPIPHTDAPRDPIVHIHPVPNAGHLPDQRGATNPADHGRNPAPQHDRSSGEQPRSAAPGTPGTDPAARGAVEQWNEHTGEHRENGFDEHRHFGPDHRYIHDHHGPEFGFREHDQQQFRTDWRLDQHDQREAREMWWPRIEVGSDQLECNRDLGVPVADYGDGASDSAGLSYGVGVSYDDSSSYVNTGTERVEVAREWRPEHGHQDQWRDEHRRHEPRQLEHGDHDDRREPERREQRHEGDHQRLDRRDHQEHQDRDRSGEPTGPGHRPASAPDERFRHDRAGDARDGQQFRHDLIGSGNQSVGAPAPAFPAAVGAPLAAGAGLAGAGAPAAWTPLDDRSQAAATTPLLRSVAQATEPGTAGRTQPATGHAHPQFPSSSAPAPTGTATTQAPGRPTPTPPTGRGDWTQANHPPAATGQPAAATTDPPAGAPAGGSVPLTAPQNGGSPGPTGAPHWSAHGAGAPRADYGAGPAATSTPQTGSAPAAAASDSTAANSTPPASAPASDPSTPSASAPSPATAGPAAAHPAPVTSDPTSPAHVPTTPDTAPPATAVADHTGVLAPSAASTGLTSGLTGHSAVATVPVQHSAPSAAHHHLAGAGIS